MWSHLLNQFGIIDRASASTNLLIYHKSFIKPIRGLFNFRRSRVGLLDLDESFSVLSPHILQIQQESLAISRIWYLWGGLLKKGSYVKFQLKVEVLIREETEQKVGLERAFIVIVLEKQAQRIKTEVKDGYLCTWLCCINLTVAVASSQGAPAIWKFSNCLPYWSSAC